VAGRHQLARVGVLQLLEIEVAAFGDAQGLGQQFGRVQRGQGLAGTQVALAVGKQAPAGLTECAVVADRGEGVLQRAAAAHMHVHIAAGHQWNALVAAETTQPLQARTVVGLAVQFNRQPQPLREAGLQPLRILDARGGRRPQAEQTGVQLFDVAAQAAVLALGRAPAAGGDQLAQRGVAALIGAQQHQFRTVLLHR